MGVRYTPSRPRRLRRASNTIDAPWQRGEGSAVDLEFTSEQEELRASVRSFLDKECSLEVVRHVVESGEPPDRALGSRWWRSTGPRWPSPRSTAASASPSSRRRWSSRSSAAASRPGRSSPPSASSPRWCARPARPSRRQRFLSEVASGTSTGAVALADHPTRLGPRRRHHARRTRRGRLGPRRHEARRHDGPRRRRGRRRRPGRRRRRGLRRARRPRPASARGPLARCQPAPLDRLARPGPRPRRPRARRARQRRHHAGRRPCRRGGDGRARARDRRRLRRALPDGPRLRQGPQAVRGARRLLPGHQAQDEQHVPRRRARPLAVLLRRRRHRRGHARRVPPPSPWPRRPATTASTWCAASRSSRSAASASPGSTTATSS